MPKHRKAPVEQADAHSQGDQYFSALMRAMADHAIVVVDHLGHVCQWGKGAEAIFGYNSHEIAGQNFSCFCPDDRLKKVLHPAQHEQIDDNGRGDFIVWCRRKDDSQFQAQCNVVAVDAVNAVRVGTEAGHDSDQRFILVLHDMSAHLSAQQALYESGQRFRILVQGVHDYAIYMLDPEGYVTNWNSGAALIKGYSADEIVGRHFSCFYTEEDRARCAPQLSLDSAFKNNTFQNEAWRVRKDGSRFWANVVIDPIFDDDGTLLGYAKVTRDVTAQKQAQDKVAQQREALHQSQKLEAIGRLTGSVAHDFNNFLAIIRTASELLESSSTLTPEKQLRYMRMISDTAARASRLTEQLLTFARRQTLQAQVFQVDRRIQEFRQIIEATLGSDRVLTISFADALPPVKTDGSQFETAVLNMVINARDATPKGGEVTISARHVTLDWLCDDGTTCKRDFTAVSVADSGAGIDPSVLANIFDPFFTTKAVGKGTGLGLSQVYGFARQSGGDVKVDSEPGKGACFTLYLPSVSDTTDDDQDWGGILSPSAQQMFPSR